MSEPSFVVDPLLAAISPDSPVGTELQRGDPQGGLYRVKTERDEAYAAEERRFRAQWEGNAEGDLARPNWRHVIQTASAVLANESKDFRVATWLTEAAVRVEGYAGLARGLAVCCGLCEVYWDNLFPRPTDDEGHMTAMGPFAGVCGEAARRQLRLWPITKDGRFSVADYLVATRAPASGDSSSSGSAAGESQAAAAEIEAAALGTGPAYYIELASDLHHAIESLRTLTSFFHEHCRPDEYGEPSIPSTDGLAEDLDQAQRIVEKLKRLTVGDDPEPVIDPDVPEPLLPTPGPAPTLLPGQIASRQDALRTLVRVAEFFERTEPHSPVPYALRQVVRWGDMKLPELLAELISDEGVRNDLTRRVGVPMPERD